MKILICPDSYKGSLSAIEAAQAMKRGADDILSTSRIETLPVGDGGEGPMDAVASVLSKRGRIEKIWVDTVDALGRKIKASYYIAGEGEGRSALMESAAAGGLTLIAREDRDIMNSDTYGTGLLMADALKRGVGELLIGMGGTATCDGGLGAFRALGDAGFDCREIARNRRITLLTDVENPLCGPKGAAAVFGPQKGALPEEIPVLDARLHELSKRYKMINGIDVSEMRYAGAAGGLAGMLMACCGAVAVSGIEYILDLTDFDHLLDGTDLVITGEGRCDATTLDGKAPMGILRRARRQGIPVALIGGQTADRDLLLAAGFSHVGAATPATLASLPTPAQAADYLTAATRALLTRLAY